MTARELYQLITDCLRAESSPTTSLVQKLHASEVLKWAEETVVGFTPVYKTVVASYHACKRDRLGDAFRKRVKAWQMANMKGDYA